MDFVSDLNVTYRLAFGPRSRAILPAFWAGSLVPKQLQWVARVRATSPYHSQPSNAGLLNLRATAASHRNINGWCSVANVLGLSVIRNAWNDPQPACAQSSIAVGLYPQATPPTPLSGRAPQLLAINTSILAAWLKVAATRIQSKRCNVLSPPPPAPLPSPCPVSVSTDRRLCNTKHPRKQLQKRPRERERERGEGGGPADTCVTRVHSFYSTNRIYLESTLLFRGQERCVCTFATCSWERSQNINVLEQIEPSSQHPSRPVHKCGQ